MQVGGGTAGVLDPIIAQIGEPLRSPSQSAASLRSGAATIDLRRQVDAVAEAATMGSTDEGKRGEEAMIISLDNLKKGLDWRLKKWPKDILNAEYYDMYGVRSSGVTETWWNATVDRLGQWKAYRGPSPPNTKADIAKRGFRRLAAIGAQYAKLAGTSAAEPNIADLSWEEVARLFDLASQIKPRSPVFASKMCHFLFPKLFIVMDNLATSVFDYEFYWRGMKDEWSRFGDKGKARTMLAEAIKSDKPLHPLYPFETKIMESSHIGHKHRV